MESIGQILKAAREHQGRTIADVALATKAKQTVIQAIEADNFDELIAPVYAKGFIKLYAETLGLNPQPLLKNYRQSRAHPGLSSKPPAPAPAPAPAARPRLPPPPAARPPAAAQTATTAAKTFTAAAQTVTTAAKTFTAASQTAPAAPGAMRPPARPPLAAKTTLLPKPPFLRKPVPPARPPRARLPWRVRFAPQLNRLRELRRYDWAAVVRRQFRALAGKLLPAGAAGLSRLRHWLQLPRARQAGMALAAVMLIGLIGAALRQAVIHRRAQYTPPAQYGWLQAPPDPYP